MVVWIGGEGGGGEVGEAVLLKVFDGCVRPNLETCTLFKTIICDCPYPISDLSEKATPISDF